MRRVRSADGRLGRGNRKDPALGGGVGDGKPSEHIVVLHFLEQHTGFVVVLVLIRSGSVLHHVLIVNFAHLTRGRDLGVVLGNEYRLQFFYNGCRFLNNGIGFFDNGRGFLHNGLGLLNNGLGLLNGSCRGSGGAALRTELAAVDRAAAAPPCVLRRSRRDRYGQGRFDWLGRFDELWLFDRLGLLDGLGLFNGLRRLRGSRLHHGLRRGSRL